MRPFLLIGSIVITAAVPAALAITPIGRGQLVGTAVGSVDYDSNIFMANPDAAQPPNTAPMAKPSSYSDWVFSETGELRYLRDVGLVSMDAGAGVVMREFAHNTDQNAADPYVDGRVHYTDGGKTDAQGTFAVRRETMANIAVNARTRSDDTALSGTVEYLPTEKLGFRVNGSLATSDYLDSAYSTTHDYILGVDAVDLYSPKLKLLAGIAGGESWSSGAGPRRGIDGRDWRYTIGAEGVLAPKVTANVSVGVVQRRFTVGERRSTATLFSDSRLTWTQTEKRSWSLEATQDFDVTALDQSVRQLGLFVSMTDALAEKVSLSARAGYEEADYTSILGGGNRADKGPLVSANLRYQLNDRTSFEVRSSYRRNESSSDNYFEAQLADFTRFTLGAVVNVRF